MLVRCVPVVKVGVVCVILVLGLGGGGAGVWQRKKEGLVGP